MGEGLGECRIDGTSTPQAALRSRREMKRAEPNNRAVVILRTSAGNDHMHAMRCLGHMLRAATHRRVDQSVLSVVLGCRLAAPSPLGRRSRWGRRKPGCMCH